MTRVGFVPTNTRLSVWPLCQFAYRAVRADLSGDTNIHPSGIAGGGVDPRLPTLWNSAERRPARKVSGPGIEPGEPAL